MKKIILLIISVIWTTAGAVAITDGVQVALEVLILLHGIAAIAGVGSYIAALFRKKGE